LGVALAVLVLAGCAELVTKDSPPEAKREAVRERALARWDLIIKGQPDKAYDYLSRGSQQVISRDEFAARMKVTAFRTADVQKTECSESSCRAWVHITYDFKIWKAVDLTMQENWLIENGNVWYVWTP